MRTELLEELRDIYRAVKEQSPVNIPSITLVLNEIDRRLATEGQDPQPTAAKSNLI